VDDAQLRQIWAVFSAESRDYVQTIAAGALELERGVDPSLLERVRRAAHSLKGAAGTLGLENLEQIAHAMEECLAHARIGTTFPAASVQTLLAAARSVEEVLDRGDAGEEPVAERLSGLVAVLASAPNELPHAPPEPPASKAAPASDILEAVAAHLRRLASPFVVDREGEIAAAARRARELGAHGHADRCERLARSFEAMGAGGTEAPRAVAAAAGVLVELRRALGGPGPAAAPRRPPPGDRAVRVSAAALDSVARHVELLAVAQARVEPRARSLLGIHAACEEALRTAAGEAEGSTALAGVERLRELVREIGSLGREALHEAARQRVEAAALREDLRGLRMIPAAAALEPLRRTAREAAGLLGKEVALQLSGTEVRIDRHVVEELRPALVHLVRNAVDHGIEPPAARGDAGKPAAGTVRVEVEPRGSRVAVVVADDGAGVDHARIREKAARSGLVAQAEAATLDDAACLGLLFRPGFSTADEVTSISGRGVGLDVVRDVATRLQGTVSIESTPGKGTRFVLDLPLTLATTSGILLRLGGTLAAVPSEAVERVLRLRRADLGTVAGRVSARIGDAQVPYAPLGQVLGMAHAAWGAPAEVQPAIVLALGGERMAFGVDEVLGKQELVVSSLGPICAPVAHLAGVALLEEGSLVGVLNAAEVLARARRGLAAGPADAPRPRILVADDSPTTRAAMTTILEIAGYAIAPAADGEDAMRRLADSPCRLVVSDVQMPRLDGLGLTRRIRSDPKLQSIPVILVTSLDSPEDRAAGLEAGADAYLVKHQVERGMLLEMVRRLLPESP
jgi:two-component system, chemotaxis family, sensor kinase CheA